jgi:hypothetical protein
MTDECAILYRKNAPRKIPLESYLIALDLIIQILLTRVHNVNQKLFLQAIFIFKIFT